MNSCQVQPWHIYLSSFIICQWRVRGSHPAVRAYGAPLSTGSPAKDFGFGIDDLGFRSANGNLKSAIRNHQSVVTKGRVELPMPRAGLDVLSVACLPVPPLGRVQRPVRESNPPHQIEGLVSYCR